MATNTPIQYTPYEIQGHELQLTAERIEALLKALDISDIAETITKKTLEDLNAIINTIKDWDDSDDDLSVKEQLINIYTKMLSEEEMDNVIDKADVNNTNDKHVPTVKALIDALAEMEQLIEDGLSALETNDINISSTTSARELAARIRNAENDRWLLCIEDKIDAMDKTISEASNSVNTTTKSLAEHESKHPFKRDTNNGGVVQTARDGTTKNAAANYGVATGENCHVWCGHSKAGGKDCDATYKKLPDGTELYCKYSDIYGEGLRGYSPHSNVKGKYNRRDVPIPLADVFGGGEIATNENGEPILNNDGSVSILGKDIRQMDWLGNLWSMGHVFTGGNGLDDENAFDNTQAILDNSKDIQTLFGKVGSIHFGKMNTEATTLTELPDNSLIVLSAPSDITITIAGVSNATIESDTIILWTGGQGDDVAYPDFRRTWISYTDDIGIESLGLTIPTLKSNNAVTKVYNGTQTATISISCPADTYRGYVGNDTLYDYSKMTG